MDPIQIVLIAVTILGNLIYKRKGAPWWTGKFMPIASFAANLVANIIIVLASIGSHPIASASHLLLASITWGSFGAALWAALKQALINALLATGTHSAIKNVREGL